MVLSFLFRFVILGLATYVYALTVHTGVPSEFFQADCLQTLETPYCDRSGGGGRCLNTTEELLSYSLGLRERLPSLIIISIQ